MISPGGAIVLDHPRCSSVAGKGWCRGVPSIPPPVNASPHLSAGRVELAQASPLNPLLPLLLCLLKLLLLPLPAHKGSLIGHGHGRKLPASPPHAQVPQPPAPPHAQLPQTVRAWDYGRYPTGCPSLTTLMRNCRSRLLWSMHRRHTVGSSPSPLTGCSSCLPCAVSQSPLLVHATDPG